MKRLIYAAIILMTISIAAIYIFIPATLSITDVALVKCPPDAALRFLSKADNWQTNRTGNTVSTADSNAFIYQSTAFNITSRLHNSFDIAIHTSGEKIASRLNILPIEPDSVAFEWKCTLATSNNPITKISQYRKGVSIKNSMNEVLNNIAADLGNKEKVYGINISKTSTKDTLLVTTKAMINGKLTTSDIYAAVGTLRKYIIAHNARETNVPIMNVTDLHNGRMQIMVAIPVDRMLAGEGDIFFRRMVPGNFLLTEVKGGQATVDAAMSTMKDFILDSKKTAMAIPFQALVTDRQQERDSAKWVTKIYYPIAY